MKRKLRYFLLLATFSFYFSSCKKEEDSNLRVILTESESSSIQGIDVEITGVQAFIESKGVSSWYRLQSTSQILNLVDIRDNVVLLGSKSELPTGVIKKILLNIGVNHSVLVDSVKYNLTVADFKGLEINLNESLSGDNTDVRIAFDLTSALIEKERNYFFNPVVIKK